MTSFQSENSIGGEPREKSGRVVWVLATVILLIAIALFVWQQQVHRPMVSDDGERGSRVLATVNTEVLTEEEFMQIAGRYASSPEEAAEHKRALVQEWVDFQVLLAQAREEGYEEDPQIRQAHERLMVNKFKEQELLRRSNTWVVGHDEIDQFYRANIEEFTSPAMIRAALIEVLIPTAASDATRTDLLQRAHAARDAALRDQESSTFGSIASEYSDNQQTRYTGGDLGWLQASGVNYKLDPKVLAELFSMNEAGSVSDVITTDAGFYVLKLVEKRPPATRPLEEVKAQIKRRLTTENRRLLSERFMAETRREHTVDVNEEVLESIQLGTKTVANDGPPMPLVNKKYE